MSLFFFVSSRSFLFHIRIHIPSFQTSALTFVFGLRSVQISKRKGVWKESACVAASVCAMEKEQKKKTVVRCADNDAMRRLRRRSYGVKKGVHAKVQR